jgi:orotate phosphoribosyltransferase-like protein
MSNRPRAETRAREERALELNEKGLPHDVIAERLGVSKLHVYDLLIRARARREQEAPQA